MSKARYILVAAIGCVAVTILWASLTRQTYDSKEVKAFFTDVHGLRSGAQVELAGVRIGIVKSVKVNPGSAAGPVEVVMDLQTTYPLPIPADTRASIGQAGLLGGPYIQLDIKGTQRAPIKSGATLKSIATEQVTPCNLLDKIADIAATDQKDKQEPRENAPVVIPNGNTQHH
jgi:phospholipid/cholesterol/gamma-HCH transport system substrate-binding protein